MKIDWGKFLTSDNSQTQFIRFLVVGSVGTTLAYLCYLVPVLLGVPPVWAYNFSFACGLVIAYLMHLKLTFRKEHNKTKLIAFIAISITNYLVGLAILSYLVSIGVAAWLAGLLFLVVTVPLGFILNRIFMLR